ncbi:unnamed protein product [Zymoseptoria tritici ST99CH_3D1]|nr:unnamed protein product [Zymoseptoria tritici ST99CH_3D1]
MSNSISTLFPLLFATLPISSVEFRDRANWLLGAFLVLTMQSTVPVEYESINPPSALAPIWQDLVALAGRAGNGWVEKWNRRRSAAAELVRSTGEDRDAIEDRNAVEDRDSIGAGSSVMPPRPSSEDAHTSNRGMKNGGMIGQACRRHVKQANGR